MKTIIIGTIGIILFFGTVLYLVYTILNGTKSKK